jgi:two-component system, response regulator FlrC
MRLIIVGSLKGQLITAAKIAVSQGAAVTHAESIEQALAVLRAKGGDLLMVDVEQPIAKLVAALEVERIRTPLVACGTSTDARAAVGADRRRARRRRGR